MSGVVTGIAEDLTGLKSWMQSKPEVRDRLRALEQRSLFRTSIAVLTGYAGFALSVYLVSLGVWWGYLLAALIIGNRLQSFENLLHEASHGNLASSRKVNHWIADNLLAMPILKSFPLYKPMHLAHHSHLGDPDKDPDYIPPPEHGESSAKIFSRKFFSRLFIRHALIGEILRCSWVARAKLVIFWGAACALVYALTDGATLLWWLVWWMIARLTVYHFLMVFQEISDHQGLDPGGIFSFSRNAPLDFLAPVFHPHYSGLHLTHHLRPRVPFFNLPEADRVLLDYEPYQDAVRCSSYLLGEESVVKSWQRNDDEPGNLD